MFCERILRRVDPGTAPIDWVDLTWFQCTRRALRARTRAGVDLQVLLPVGQYPAHGDVLHEDDSTTIAVNLLPAPVLIARPSTAADLARLALELGNLHVPTQVSGGELVVVPDGPTEALFRKLGVCYRAAVRQFVPERSSVAAAIAPAADFAIRATAAAP